MKTKKFDWMILYYVFCTLLLIVMIYISIRWGKYFWGAQMNIVKQIITGAI